MTSRPGRICAEWVVIAFGFATICVVLGFCLWRLMAVTDQMNRREAIVNRVLENQAVLMAGQREILHILAKYR